MPYWINAVLFSLKCSLELYRALPNKALASPSDAGKGPPCGVQDKEIACYACSKVRSVCCLLYAYDEAAEAAACANQPDCGAQRSKAQLVVQAKAVMRMQQQHLQQRTCQFACPPMPFEGRQGHRNSQFTIACLACQPATDCFHVLAGKSL